MLVLICGDHNWTDHAAVEREIITHGLDPIRDVIMHGGAKGADTISGEVATKHGFKVEAIKANWGLYGKAAGPIRNKWMLDRNPDLVLAFHTNIEQSKGTKNMVKIAREKGVEVEVFSK